MSQAPRLEGVTVCGAISGKDENGRPYFCSFCVDRLEELLSKRTWRKSRRNVVQREKEAEVYDAIKDAAPEWWDDDTEITLDKNMTCKRHTDHSEHAYVLWLGHYAGGALNFDDGKRIRGQQEWHKINGQIPHWYDPHQGTKYSVIICKGKRQTIG